MKRSRKRARPRTSDGPVAGAAPGASVQGQTSGAVTFQPAASVLQSAEELELIKAILARTECLARFRAQVCELSVVDLGQRLSQIRGLTTKVVECVAEWRKRFLRPYPFVWKGTNVLLKMTVDLDFVHFARPVGDDLGFSMLRNPFAIREALNGKATTATLGRLGGNGLDIDVASLRRAVASVLQEEVLYGQYVPPKAFHSKLRDEFREGRLALERRIAKQQRAKRLEAEKAVVEQKRANQVKSLNEENQRLRDELAALQRSRGGGLTLPSIGNSRPNEQGMVGAERGLSLSASQPELGGQRGSGDVGVGRSTGLGLGATAAPSLAWST